jgi:anti-sigma regulatory factor (Ser/Thr protein kinase)
MNRLFEIQSRTENLKTIREEVRPLLEKAGFPVKDIESILVALGEACTNAIRHAYANEPHHTIQVTYEEDDEKIVLKIRDYGKKFDASQIKKPKLPPERGGGLGLYFMQTIMDKMRYNTDHDEGKELILTKYKKEGGCGANPN